MHKSNLSNDYTDIIIIIIIIISIIINLYWFKWRCHANDAGALYRVISNMNINESRDVIIISWQKWQNSLDLFFWSDVIKRN